MGHTTKESWFYSQKMQEISLSSKMCRLLLSSNNPIFDVYILGTVSPRVKWLGHDAHHLVPQLRTYHAIYIHPPSIHLHTVYIDNSVFTFE